MSGPTQLRKLCGFLEDRSVFHDKVSIALVRNTLELAVDASEKRIAELRAALDEEAASLRTQEERIAALEAENASLRLTGNPNAVNCDAHGHSIAYIPANGPCPACKAWEAMGGAEDMLAELGERYAELESEQLNREGGEG